MVVSFSPLHITCRRKTSKPTTTKKSQRPFYLLPSDIGSNKHIFVWFPKMMPLFEFGRGAIMSNTGTMDPLICTTIYDLSSSEPSESSEVRDERVHWLIPNALLKRPILPPLHLRTIILRTLHTFASVHKFVCGDDATINIFVIVPWLVVGLQAPFICSNESQGFIYS